MGRIRVGRERGRKVVEVVVLRYSIGGVSGRREGDEELIMSFHWSGKLYWAAGELYV